MKFSGRGGGDFVNQIRLGDPGEERVFDRQGWSVKVRRCRSFVMSRFAIFEVDQEEILCKWG